MHAVKAHILASHSKRQPVPDNQEAFLTPDGPFDARLIFEIAEYIEPDDNQDLPPTGFADQESLNLAAVKYYMDDLANVTNDAWKSVGEPRRISLGESGSHSMNQYPAYYLEAQITSKSSSQAQSWLHLLFVRVPQYGSEFIFQMFVKDGNLSAAENSRIAQAITFKIAKTLDFNNFATLVGS